MEANFKADLNEYISQCKVRLARILRDLNWTEAATLKVYNANSIAFSPRHDMKQLCAPPLKSFFPDSCATQNSVVLDTPKLQGLLENNTLKAPDNFTELQGNFSREQKLKLYEHAIENTQKLDHNLFDKEDEGEISLADILAQKKREEKRKKRRFRKSKPTHIEEVRGLVSLQMQALEQFLGNKIKKVDEGTLQRRGSKQHDYGKDIKGANRTRLKDCGRKTRDSEMYTKNHGIENCRSLSKEIQYHKRSSNGESTYVGNNDSHHGESGKHSISSSHDICQDRKKHRSKGRNTSKERRRHSRSRSKKSSREGKRYSDRRSRSHSKHNSKDRQISKSISYEAADNGTCQKHSSRRELSHRKHSKGKYKKYYRNKSSSPESYRKKHSKHSKEKYNKHYRNQSSSPDSFRKKHKVSERQ